MTIIGMSIAATIKGIDAASDETLFRSDIYRAISRKLTRLASTSTFR